MDKGVESCLSKGFRDGKSSLDKPCFRLLGGLAVFNSV